MIDSATGRVWRYTKVTASEQQVKNFIDRLINLEELRSPQPFTEQERKARDTSLRGEHASEIESLAHPCSGLVTCLVSEVVK